MLRWAIVFFVIAMIAGVFGIPGIAGAATNITWIFAALFLVTFVASLVMGIRNPV